MILSPTAALDRITGGRGIMAIKYSMVSVVGVVLGVTQLTIYSQFLGFDPVLSNVLSVMITAIPAFLLNKRWVWGSDGRISFTREIVPFWVFTGMGLALSTGLVAAAQTLSDSHVLVVSANLAGFGLLWVAKFVFLDKIMFGHLDSDSDSDPDRAAAGGAKAS